jgi:rRNA-processing protein FCF1
VKSVLIDTNTLVLFIAGNIDPSRLGGRRLESFDERDLALLNRILKGFPRHVSFPNILTEASNLLGAGKQELVKGAAIALARYVHRVAEVYAPSRKIVDADIYMHVGLTDAVIHTMTEQDVTVLTTDHELYGRLLKRGLEVINLLHFKTPR